MRTFQDGTLKGTILEYSLSPLPPALAPNGVDRIYRVRARYLYALNRPPADDERIRVGVLPFTKYAAGDAETTLPMTIYTPRLGP